MALPMLIGMMSHMLLNIVDGIYVSRLGMEASLAVLNYGFPFFYLIFAVFNGLTSGTTSMLARAIGAKRIDEAENSLSQIVWVGLLIFGIFLCICPLAVPYYLDLQKASPLAAQYTKDYLIPLFAGMPFTVLALLLGSGLRAEGNTRTLMKGLLLGTLANIIIAPFLIYDTFRFAGRIWTGLDLGVAGAGWASTLSSFLSVLVVLAIFLKGNTVLRLRLWPTWGDKGGLKESFAVGLPSILSQSLIGINITLLTALATPFGGAAIAAIGIGSRLESLAVFPSLAIMIAVLSLVGQNFGAKRYDRVAESVRLGLITAFGTLLVIGIAVHFLREPLIALFRPEAATLPSANHYVGILSLGFGFAGISIVSSGAFQGLGRGLPFLFLNTLRLVFLALPAGWLLSRTQGEYGLHYAPIIASGITAVVAATWILSTVSRLKRMPAAEPAPVPTAT
jgi:putative MATE family efflux protein